MAYPVVFPQDEIDEIEQYPQKQNMKKTIQVLWRPKAQIHHTAYNTFYLRLLDLVANAAVSRKVWLQRYRGVESLAKHEPLTVVIDFLS